MKELTVDRCRKQILRLKKCISEGYVSINERDYLQALEIALPILEQQERGERQERGEWIEWGGGECPTEKSERLDLKLRNGYITRYVPAGCVDDWSHKDLMTDIIAYRIIPERDINQNGEQ